MSCSGDKCEQGKHLHVMCEPSVGHVVKQAEVGFSTGGEKYDMYRPSYTEESAELIVSEILSLSREASKDGIKYHVLELGAGTGKMTEVLSRKLPEYVKYLATDVSENFLEVLKRKGLRVDVSLASADNIPLEDNSVESIVCAQCFHWFYDKKDLESIYRALVPGGKLILIWNRADFDEDWMGQLIELIELRKKLFLKVQGSLKFDINGTEWRKEIDTSPLFSFLWYKVLPGVNIHADLETVLSTVTTSSVYKSLTEEERDAYVLQLRETITNRPGIDLNNIKVPYKTELYVYTSK